MEEVTARAPEIIGSDGVMRGVVSGDRLIALPAKFWNDAKVFLGKAYGPSVNLVLSKFAEDFGRAYARRMLAEGAGRREAFRAMEGMASAAGWGRVRVSGDFEAGDALTVEVADCAFCLANSDGDKCNFTSGVAVGAASAVFGREYVNDHVDITRGDELRCVLSLRPSNRTSCPDWKPGAYFPWLLER
jgi:predicted hydrocarbon binding protein